MPLTFDYPGCRQVQHVGRQIVGPEFMSLYLALSVYTASFIAEIVRAGIVGVSKGQTEAASALGLDARPNHASGGSAAGAAHHHPAADQQYLNLTKNSSLAVAIGYADLVAVGGTILNQTGHSIEIIAIWMVVYVSISLADIAVHELVQRQNGIGGALTWQCNNIAFVRTDIPARPQRLRWATSTSHRLGAQEPVCHTRRIRS